MNETIQKVEINKLNHYGRIYSLLLSFTMISSIPLFIWLGTWAFIPWGMLFLITMFYALKIEKIKKHNNIQTYKEIKAFSKGILLNDTEKQREVAKRSGEKILLVAATAAITVILCTSIGILLHIFFN